MLDDDRSVAFFRCTKCGLPHELPEDRSMRCELADDRSDEIELSPSGVPPLGALIRERYRVEGLLGEGGMGVVVRCWDRHIGRPVAVKLGPAADADEAHHRRFVREARIMADSSDPATVQVFDYGVLPDQRPYLVMELLEGETLDARLDREGVLEASEAVDIAAEILMGLKGFHAAGRVHRDLKPGNVFLSSVNGPETTVRLLDFGLARDIEERRRITGAGKVLGTPSYMPPEQLCGDVVDQRSDVFAVGTLLFEMLTGGPPTVPREDESLGRFLRRAASERAPRLTERQDVDPDLARVVDRSLELEPSGRFAHAGEMLDALLAATDLSSSSSWRIAPRRSSAPPARATRRRRPQSAAREPRASRT